MCNIFATDYLDNLNEKNEIQKIIQLLTDIKDNNKIWKLRQEQDKLLWSEMWYSYRRAYNLKESE